MSTLRAFVAAVLLCQLVMAQDNVLVLVLDDVGPDRIASYSQLLPPGSVPASTPVMDSLAENGQLFTNVYSQCVCSPTRLAALSGQYGFRTGIGVAMPWEKPGSASGGFDFDLRSVNSIPQVISSTHKSAAFGKWHLSTDLNQQLADPRKHPISFGFDYFYGTPANLGVVGDDPQVFYDFQWVEADANSAQEHHITEYATSFTVDVALDWIRDQRLDPWFAWVGFHSAHNPLHVPPSHLVTNPVTANSSSEDLHRAMVEAMDSEIGRLLTDIRPAVLASTWVVVIGDNGNPKNTVPANSVWPPFEKVKPTPYQGNVNVPMIIYRPGIPGPGVTQDDMINVTDLYATLLSVMGHRSNEDDSVSFSDSLQDPDSRPTREFVYGERFRPNGFGPYTLNEWYVTDGEWKLLQLGALTRFVHLGSDPGEETNLLAAGLNTEQQHAYEQLMEYHENLIGN